ncbi:MAG: methyltransferase domain-containing protein [Candidatus Heimdallarchaeaceae archaeon]
MTTGFCPKHSPQYYEEFLREIDNTREFRKKIYEQIGLKDARRVLEVGCRRGVISKELREFTDAQITAIDSDHMAIADASSRIKGVEFFRDTEEKLSMRDESFDIVVCHYFFLWRSKPFGLLMELKRVCKTGGYIVALAEPDYDGWIEHPDLNLGKYHKDALKGQGANPSVGRRLLSLFSSGGLESSAHINSRIWSQEEIESCIEKEWKNIFDEGLITEEEFNAKIAEERKIIGDNHRVLALPVFTAIGKKVILEEDIIDPYD